ncbi:hypothetical protein F4811DRAFT_222269 [Daldinia bambusicola]|nr:hypothetical protein F4811DRAFT_222269 [Daldinia bambusicola]
MGERTGSRVFQILWSYVIDWVVILSYNPGWLPNPLQPQKPRGFEVGPPPLSSHGIPVILKKENSH